MHDSNYTEGAEKRSGDEIKAAVCTACSQHRILTDAKRQPATIGVDRNLISLIFRLTR